MHQAEMAGTMHQPGIAGTMHQHTKGRQKLEPNKLGTPGLDQKQMIFDHEGFAKRLAEEMPRMMADEWHRPRASRRERRPHEKQVDSKESYEALPSKFEGCLGRRSCDRVELGLTLEIETKRTHRFVAVLKCREGLS